MAAIAGSGPMEKTRVLKSPKDIITSTSTSEDGEALQIASTPTLTPTPTPTDSSSTPSSSVSSGTKRRTRTVLWTVPRAISTAFERVIVELGHKVLAERGETLDVLHEPYGQPFYFGPTEERGSTRFAKDAPLSDRLSTYDGVRDALLNGRNPEKEPDHVFSKDMAYYMRGRINKEMLEGVQHTFLIRHPSKSIPSLYRSSLDTELTGWDYFDPQEGGYEELSQIFDVVTKELGQTPVVIDADDLLADPSGVTAKYCEAIGLPYSEDILRWTPGPVEGWEAWPGWHDDAINSCGLIKRTPAKEGASSGGHQKYAKELAIPEVQETIADATPHYEAVAKHRLT